MAEITKPPRTRRRTKIGRIRISLNVVVQIVLVLFLAAMLNSFAFKHYKRWDFSRDQKSALSDKTKRFLHTLKGKMRIPAAAPSSRMGWMTRTFTECMEDSSPGV